MVQEAELMTETVAHKRLSPIVHSQFTATVLTDTLRRPKFSAEPRGSIDR